MPPVVAYPLFPLFSPMLLVFCMQSCTKSAHCYGLTHVTGIAYNNLSSMHCLFIIIIYRSLCFSVKLPCILYLSGFGGTGPFVKSRKQLPGFLTFSIIIWTLHDACLLVLHCLCVYVYAWTVNVFSHVSVMIWVAWKKWMDGNGCMHGRMDYIWWMHPCVLWQQHRPVTVWQI